MQAVLKNGTLLAGIIVSALICAAASRFLLTPVGTIGPLVFQSQSVLAALIALGVCLAIAVVVAIGVARVTNTVVGLFVLGAGMYGLSGRMATAKEMAYTALGSSNGVLWLAAIEALLWAVVVLLCVLAVFAASGPLRDVEPNEQGTLPNPFGSMDAMKSSAFGLLVLAAVWLLAQSPMKGQMIAATTVGGVLSGLFGRLIAPHVQPLLMYPAPVVAGAVGYMVANFMMKSSLSVAMANESMPALGLPMPIDYAAGALMGVSIGLGWARSFLHHEEVHQSGAS